MRKFKLIAMVLTSTFFMPMAYLSIGSPARALVLENLDYHASDVQEPLLFKFKESRLTNSNEFEEASVKYKRNQLTKPRYAYDPETGKLVLVGGLSQYNEWLDGTLGEKSEYTHYAFKDLSSSMIEPSKSGAKSISVSKSAVLPYSPIDSEQFSDVNSTSALISFLALAGLVGLITIIWRTKLFKQTIKK